MIGHNADFTVVLEESKQVIRECFRQHSVDEVFLSFNGGKDCTVLLDVTLDVLRETIGQPELKILCIKTNNPFRELEDFMRLVESHYAVQLSWSHGELKAALEQTLAKDPRLKACLMGTRRTDPYCEDLQFTQKTDESWPPLLRVSPLLNWSYHQIWSYILERNVPYCSLYDKGYTSIGSTLNTWPNPALAYKDSCGCLAHHPAWTLADGALERAGRGPRGARGGEPAVRGGGGPCLVIPGSV